MADSTVIEPLPCSCVCVSCLLAEERLFSEKPVCEPRWRVVVDKGEFEVEVGSN